MKLRDYQIKALDDVREAYRRRAKGVLLVMPTGAGKTLTATRLAQLAAAKGTRTVFTAHRKELVSQLSGALTQWGVEHGVIAPWAKENGAPVQVASVGTLARRQRLDKRGRYRFDLVVTDEAHHLAPGTQWFQVLEHNPAAKYLGITATPCRLDGKPLGVQAGGAFDALVEGPTILDLIEEG
ncbi:MAG TPA: DEAD/DEAH box helicase family protein, partial [Gammaproteobacteria bacterium]|nr:DEAD/DEAH box helicase family protein [Gammaproteobacteria bacterium]